MTEFELFADIIFYGAPFVFVTAGFVLGWTLKEYFRTKDLKKMGDDYND